jgi:sugar lactone lactonase YvrE
MKLTAIFSFLLLTINLDAQSYSNPESVAYDAVSNRYLISNSNNGQIIARASNGSLSVFKSGISPQPYGIEVVGNVVYANCGGFVRGYSLTDASQVFSVNTGATFLNGIASDGNGHLFVTDFSGKKIYRVNISSQTSNVMATGLVQSPNGMIYEADNNRLVFVNWGGNAPIKAMSLSDSTVSVVATTSYSNCDGIAKDNLGNYYISSWGTSGIIKYTSTFTSPEIILTGLSQPADIFFNELTDTLAIPVTGANNVVFLGVEGGPVISPCSEVPISVDPQSITFGYVNPSFGDSVLSIPITNISDLGFAYPLAQVIPNGELPVGMSFDGTDEIFVVFASAWNPDSTAIANFHFNVSQEILENTFLNFTLRVFNLLPSTIDTCFFESEFSINLRPSSPLGNKLINNSTISIFPNPSSGLISIRNIESSALINVIDLSGRVIETKIGPGDFNLQKGLYFIRVNSENALITKRIIVQ